MDGIKVKGQRKQRAKETSMGAQALTSRAQDASGDGDRQDKR